MAFMKTPNLDKSKSEYLLEEEEFKIKATKDGCFSN
jgi:hypothetical protein